jgi:hypothetical protein
LTVRRSFSRALTPLRRTPLGARATPRARRRRPSPYDPQELRVQVVNTDPDSGRVCLRRVLF